jgi:hypothetical protein
MALTIFDWESEARFWRRKAADRYRLLREHNLIPKCICDEEGCDGCTGWVEEYGFDS